MATRGGSGMRRPGATPATPDSRRPRPPTGPMDGHTRQLCEMMMEMYDQHIVNRDELDRLMSELRLSESDLQKTVQSEADSKADVGCRRLEADRTTELQEKRVAALEKDLRQLEAERDERDRVLRKLEADLQGALAQVNQAQPTNHDADALLQQMQTLEEREKYLRELEAKLLAAEDLRLEGNKTLRALMREHEELGAIQGKYYQSVQQEMVDNQRVAETLSQQLKEITERKMELSSKKRTAIDEKRKGEQYYQQLVDVKNVLEGDLRKSQQGLARAEQELAVHLNDLLGPYSRHERQLEKLEETMMLLKAAAINLNSDHAFIGEVNERASVIGDMDYRGLQSFNDAFRYIKSQVELVHGPQKDGERWQLRGGEIGYEAIEPLLSALKQAVTCYDMMTDQGKEEIPYTREIISNSTHLLNLVHETMVKYQEIERAREEEAMEVERAKEQKKKERLAKKYAPKPRDPYSRAPATAYNRGPGTPRSGHAGHPSTSSAPDPRPPGAATSTQLLSPIREERRD